MPIRIPDRLPARETLIREGPFSWGRTRPFLLQILAAVAVIVGVVALFITYSADEVAAAQDTKEALDAGEL